MPSKIFETFDQSRTWILAPRSVFNQPSHIDNTLLRLRNFKKRKNISKLKSFKSSSQKIKINIKINDVVFHERFGKGEVKQIEEDGENSRATINFNNSGEKKVLLKFAKLKVIK